MNNALSSNAMRLAFALLLLCLGFASGYGWFWKTQIPIPEGKDSAGPDAQARRVLYWYDPMVPQQHFDKSGKSPFMDMELVPRYADENAAGEGGNTADSAGTLRIDPAITQNLGMRTAPVVRSALPVRIDAIGNLRYNARDIAVVQLRAGAFVEKVWPHAAGDIVQKGTPLVELLVPDWAVLQREYVNLKTRGNTALLNAARERLQIAGMPEDAIMRLERSGDVQRPSAVLSLTGMCAPAWHLIAARRWYGSTVSRPCGWISQYRKHRQGK